MFKKISSVKFSYLKLSKRACAHATGKAKCNFLSQNTYCCRGFKLKKFDQNIPIICRKIKNKHPAH